MAASSGETAAWTWTDRAVKAQWHGKMEIEVDERSRLIAKICTLMKTCVLPARLPYH